MTVKFPYRLGWPRAGRFGAHACLYAAACVAAVGWVVPTPALAYSTPSVFTDSPTVGGGGRRFFTGSPAEGYSCDVCHEQTGNQIQYPAYVSGLPLDGYDLKQTQQVVISWPEFAARWQQLKPDPMAALPPGFIPPAMGLLAEFVAESGKASGTLEIDTKTASDAERCERTRPNLEPKIAAQLYQVRPGIEPRLVKSDSTGKLRCVSGQLGQRCIVAMKSCGAKEVRVTWQAPSTWEGPIWFSAGFVATDTISGSYDLDSSTEISLPLLPKNTENRIYRQMLSGNCAVASPGNANSKSGTWVFGLMLILGFVPRSLQSIQKRGSR